MNYYINTKWRKATVSSHLIAAIMKNTMRKCINVFDEIHQSNKPGWPCPICFVEVMHQHFTGIEKDDELKWLFNILAT